VTRLDRRLGLVELTAQRRQRAAPRRRYDASGLTPREQYELSLLLDRVRSAVSLTPDEEARLATLVARMRVTEEGSRSS
jgi:hypothetical protein